jgi:hypothetical protein
VQSTLVSAALVDSVYVGKACWSSVCMGAFVLFHFGFVLFGVLGCAPAVLLRLLSFVTS